MTTYTKILKSLKRGCFVVIYDPPGEDNYTTITPMKNNLGAYIRSSWCNGIKDAKQGTEGWYWIAEEEIIDACRRRDWRIIEFYQLKPEERFEIGDKVEVSEDYYIDDLAGSVVEITEVKDDLQYNIQAEQGGWTIHHNSLLPHYKNMQWLDKEIGDRIKEEIDKLAVKEEDMSVVNLIKGKIDHITKK